MQASAYRTIASDQALDQYLSSLEARGVSEIAIDFEGEFNLHVYGNHLCLVQIFDGSELVIIDPFKLKGEGLKRLLEAPGIAKIIYDCASDGSLLGDEYGIKLGPVIDLRPAVDFLAFPKKDLSTVLGAVLGIEVIKKKKFQMYNWMRRPIQAEAMEYALNDVRELFRLRDALMERLEAAGQLKAWQERNKQLQPDGLRKAKLPRLFKSWEFQKLDKAGKSRFERLFAARDTLARAYNLPPNMVVENAQLFELAAGRLDSAQIRLNRRLSGAELDQVREAMAAAIRD